MKPFYKRKTSKLTFKTHHKHRNAEEQEDKKKMGKAATRKGI